MHLTGIGGQNKRTQVLIILCEEIWRKMNQNWNESKAFEISITYTDGRTIEGNNKHSIVID